MAERLPNEVKRKRGTLRPDRVPQPITTIAALPPAMPASLDQPPTHLGPAGTETWQRVVVHCRSWLAESDLGAVQLLAEAMDKRADLMARLQSEGWTLYTEKGYAYAHPAAGQLQAVTEEARKWMQSLGLTPADRSRLGVAEVKARSALQELAAKRDAHLRKTRPA
jgi:P27 family predicted phage terminase small subunit